MSGDITYTYPVGGPRFSKQACHLADSIQEFCAKPDIVTYLLNQERETVPDRHIALLEEKTTLVEGERPIEKYPISAKLGALIAGAKESNRPYLAHLDTDTLLLNDFNMAELGDKDVYLKPVDAGFLQWGRKDSFPDWEVLYEKRGMDFKGATIHSDIDNQPIPRMYNAGVVIAENGAFPERWLEMTRFVFDKFPHQRFSDQVALGLLFDTFDVGKLTQKHSFLMGGHYWCPSNINVLRYQDYPHLLRIPNPLVWMKLSRLGLTPKKLYKMDDGHTWRKALTRLINAFAFRHPKFREKFGVPFW